MVLDANDAFDDGPARTTGGVLVAHPFSPHTLSFVGIPPAEKEQ